MSRTMSSSGNDMSVYVGAGMYIWGLPQAQTVAHMGIARIALAIIAVLALHIFLQLLLSCSQLIGRDTKSIVNILL